MTALKNPPQVTVHVDTQLLCRNRWKCFSRDHSEIYRRSKRIVVINKTFKYRLFPSKSQAVFLDQTLETCRYWYNNCLSERKDAWENEKKSVGKFKQLARVKDYRKENPYAAQVHSHIMQVVVQDLDKAFQAFFRRVKSGETPGYPRFKGRNRFDSFGLKEYGNGFKIDGRRLRITGIGRLRVRWHREMEGTVKTVRILKRAGEWYACFSCEVEEKVLPATGKQVGIDVGIHHLLATSDGDVVDNPQWYREAQSKLRVIQRTVSRRTMGGSNRRKSVLALQRQHETISNSRKDFLNKLAFQLVTNYDLIALEKLNINGMARNHHLSKSIMDAGWGYLSKRISDKAADAGRHVVQVNPAYTSKTCSSCGMIFETLTLADRWVECDCGLSIDRDVNAAINILKRAGYVRWDKSTDAQV